MTRKNLTTLALVLIVILGTLGVNPRPAQAEFSPLLDPTQIANFQEICYDVGSVSQIIMLFQTNITVFAASSPGGQVSAALFSIAQFAQGFQDICRLVLAVATAKDTAGVLRAARVANRMSQLDLESHLDMIEDSISMYDFLDNLKNSKQSNKQKLLNVNNYSRVLNFSLRNLPLDGIDAKVVAQKLGKEERRASMLADMTDSLYGCRVPMKENKKNEMNAGDGSFISDSRLKGLEASMGKYASILNRSSAIIPKIAKTLRDMLSSVTTLPEERRGALGALNRFLKEGAFAAVAFIPPTSSEKTPGEIGVKPNKIADYQPPENPESGPPIRIRPAFIEIEDGTDSYYKSSGSQHPGPCRQNKDQTRLENWMFTNASVLTDPYIKKEWIVDSVTVCPYSKSNILFDTLIHSLAVSFDQEQMDKVLRTATKTLEDNCKKRNSIDLVKQFNKTESFGYSDTVNADRYKSDPCKVSDAQTDNMRPLESKLPVQIKNMADFVLFYNDAFSKFVATEYKLSLSENPISESMRQFSRSTTDLARGSDGSYASNNRYSMKDPPKISPEQMRFLQRWRSVSLCFLPSHLLRVYPDAKALIESPSNNPEEFASLVKLCQDQEITIANNGNIFRDYFSALVDEMILLANAKAEIFKVDVTLGAFMSNGSAKPAGCYEDYTPADVALTSARTQVLAVESLDSLNKAVDKLVEQNMKIEADTKLEAERLEDVTKTTIGAIRMNRIKAAKALYDPNNPQIDYGKLAPDTRGVSKIDKEHGMKMGK